MGSSRIVPYTIEVVVDRGVWTPIEWHVRQHVRASTRRHADGKPTTLNIRRWVGPQERATLPGGSNEHIGPTRILSARIKDQRTGAYVAEWNRSEDPAFANRALSPASKRSAMVSGLTLADYEAIARQQQQRGPTGTLAMGPRQTVAMTPGGTIVTNRAGHSRIRFVRNRGEFAGQIEGGWRAPIGWVIASDGVRHDVYSMDEANGMMTELRRRLRENRHGNRANGAKKHGQWAFVARRGSDSKHVYVKRELAEQIAESPAGTRDDYLALWLVPPFYVDAGEGLFRTEHGGLPPAWDYMRGKLELPEDFLRDPNEWLERVKREEYPTYEKRAVAGTREWSARNRARTTEQQRRARAVIRTTAGSRPYDLVPVVGTTDYSTETGSQGGTVRVRVARPEDSVWDIVGEGRLVVSAGGNPIGYVSRWEGKNPWAFQTIEPEGEWYRVRGMLLSAPSRAEAIERGERVNAGFSRSRNYAGRMRIGARQPSKQKIEVDTVTGPSYWASALVNGDESGIGEEAELAALHAWIDKLAKDGWSVVDIARNEEGDGQKPRFTWSFHLYGGTAQGGEVVDYVIHRIGRNRKGQVA